MEDLLLNSFVLYVLLVIITHLHWKQESKQKDKTDLDTDSVR